MNFLRMEQGETTIKILFIGDIVGSVGRKAVKSMLPALKNKFQPDFVIANGENAAGGRGITLAIAKELFEWGIHGITLGNHTWDNKDIYDWIETEPRMVRPANYPPNAPGRGCTILRNQDKELVLINLMGRTFLPPLDCPFRKADEILSQLDAKHRCILVDFHAEATSEKISMGWYLDGRVSAVLGTHTHVQTHDERILPGGTAYITDVGMVGPMDGVLGMEKEPVIQKFLTQMPVRFVVAEGKWHFHGVFLEIDEVSGKAGNMQIIRIAEQDVLFE